MDLAPFGPYFDRSKRAIAGIFIETGAEIPDIGTGTLAIIGGQEFVLTAGHNVWNADANAPYAIGIGRPPGNLILLVRPGDGSAGRVFHSAPAAGEDPEPDVAVIELTAKTQLASREPFTEDDIRFFDTNVLVPTNDGRWIGRDLVVTGLPAYMARVSDGLKLTARAGTRLQVTTDVPSMKTTNLPALNKDRFADGQPPEGRGVHVYLNQVMQEEDGTELAFKRPHGMSGGPAVVPEGAGILCGLMRGVVRFGGGWDAWYEPAAEAVRLLIQHDNPAVSTAASRICARYDADRATARAVPKIDPNDISWSFQRPD